MSSNKQDSFEIEYVGSLKGHNGWVTAIAVGKDAEGKPLLISGSRDKKIILWKLNLDAPEDIQKEEGKKVVEQEKLVGKPFKSLSGHSHFVSSLSLSKDSKFLLSSSWDRTSRLWDLNTFKTRTLINGHSKDVLAVTFTNEDRMIVSGSMDKSLKVFNIKGEEKHSNNDFSGWITNITHIKQEKQNLLAVASQDKTVKVYDTNEYTVKYNIEGFDYPVVSTAVDEDGEFLFSAEKNGIIRVHNLPSLVQKSTIEVNADINTISFESAYFTSIVIGTNKGLIIQEVKSQKGKPLFEKKSFGACLSLCWDVDKKYLFAGFADGGIRIYKFNK